MFCPSGLHLLDCFINCLILTPTLICYWCGLFELYDIYFNYDQDLKFRNSIILTAIGSCFFLAFFVYPLVERLIRNLHPTLKQNLTYVTLMIGGVFHMAYWKGLWMISELILCGAEWRLELAVVIGCLVVKMFTTSVNTLLFPPFSSSPDVCHEVLKAKNIFGHQFPGVKARPLFTFVLGSLFTMFFVHLFTIFSWASTLSLVGKLKLNWFGLNYLLAVGCFLSVTLFSLEILLAKLRRWFLTSNNKKSSNIKTVQVAMSNTTEVACAPLNRTDVVNIERGKTIRQEDKSPKPFFTVYRMKQLLFDDVLNLITFAVEAIFFKSYWDLFAHTFLVERLFGAGMLTTVGAILVILSGTCNLFGGINFENDIEDISEAEDAEVEDFVFSNLYIRYFQKLSKISINL